MSCYWRGQPSASLFGISDVAHRKAKSISLRRPAFVIGIEWQKQPAPAQPAETRAKEAKGRKRMAMKWAQLIGFAQESDYTFPTAAPPFLSTCLAAKWQWHTLARSSAWLLFTARLESPSRASSADTLPRTAIRSRCQLNPRPPSCHWPDDG